MTDVIHAADVGTAGFAVTVEDSLDGVITVCVAGDVDMATSPRLDDAIAGAQRTCRAVLLDLRQVTFIGSSGLSVLVKSAHRAEESHGALAVLPGSHAVRRAIDVTGLAAALHLFTDPASAADHLRAGPDRTSLPR